MPKDCFFRKILTGSGDPKNLVAGLINSPDARESLKIVNI
jgi:hypothetical protein